MGTARGRRVRALLLDGGFERVQTSASFRWDGTRGAATSFGELLAARLQLPEFVERLQALGWATASELADIAAACARWTEHPHVFAAMVMGEAVGWKA